MSFRLKTVHPHGRGEHCRSSAFRALSGGSSPRAWGTRAGYRVGRGGARFIPTGVGNTARTASTRTVRPVHPHGRGEHALVFRDGNKRNGSSPRAWGTPNRNAGRTARNRFIPTGVGNTTGTRNPAPFGAVHPHGRGEHCLSAAEAGTLVGSSPRAWGTHWQDPPRAARGRFIPTGVGNTLESSACPSGNAVHPHGRGEHRLRSQRLTARRRFIPTGVGNTSRIT